MPVVGLIVFLVWSSVVFGLVLTAFMHRGRPRVLCLVAAWVIFWAFPILGLFAASSGELSVESSAPVSAPSQR
jgi:hypothetical protein